MISADPEAPPEQERTPVASDIRATRTTILARRIHDLLQLAVIEPHEVTGDAAIQDDVAGAIVPVRHHAGSALRALDPAAQLRPVGVGRRHRLTLRPRAPTTHHFRKVSPRQEQSAALLAIVNQVVVEHAAQERGVAARTADFGVARPEDPDAVATDGFRKRGRATMRADVVAARVESHCRAAVDAIHPGIFA